MIPLLLLLQVVATAPRVTAYHARVVEGTRDRQVYLEVTIRGPGRVRIPLPDGTPDSLDIAPKGPGKVLVQPTGARLLEVESGDSLVSLTVAWTGAAGSPKRFHLVNTGAEELPGFRVTYEMPPGEVPRLVRPSDLPGASQRIELTGETRIVELRVPSLGAGETATLHVTTAPAGKSLLPLLVGVGLALVHLVRRRSILEVPGPSA